MSNLPYLIDAEEAIEYYKGKSNLTDAEKAYIVAILTKEGLSNKDIRRSLGIDKVYTVTHLKRVGTSLTDAELNLWHKNPSRITLGHTRAIARLPAQKREELLRGLLTKRTPVHKFESIAKGKEEDRDSDIKRHERIMGEVLGRQVRIRFNPTKLSGSLTLDFFGLDDFEHISRCLGFKADDHL
ncbi:transcriptional regulator (plasmid) [Microbulbifer sp. TRSA002]|uniref:transcriptional regulator n=1 Tax=Microbulbifer sp. TRSA002 TaxID=3243382 RepID=UPI0040395B25